jgi:hypothetical protein
MTTVYDINVSLITNKYKKKVETQLPYLREITGYNNDKYWYMLLSPKENKAMRNEILKMSNERRTILINLNRPSTKLEELEYKQTTFYIERTKIDKKRTH